MATTMPTQPVTTVHIPDYDAKRKRYKDRLSSLGVAEMVIGVICLVFGIANISVIVGLGHGDYYRNYFNLLLISPSIWCTVPLFVSGALGVCSTKNPSVCMFNANLGAAIVSSFAALILFVFSLISAILVSIIILQAFHSILTAASFILFIVCIVHASHCCAAICCIPWNQPPPAMYFPAQVDGNVQLVNNQFVPATSVPEDIPAATASGETTSGQQHTTTANVETVYPDLAKEKESEQQ